MPAEQQQKNVGAKQEMKKERRRNITSVNLNMDGEMDLCCCHMFTIQHHIEIDTYILLFALIFHQTVIRDSQQFEKWKET